MKEDLSTVTVENGHRFAHLTFSAASVACKQLGYIQYSSGV